MTKPDKISNTASSYIPHQLKEWQFIPVNRQSKHPLESNWQNRGVPYDSPELAIWLKAGNNYGVLTNENQFVIDADSPEIVKIIESEFPPTFTVLSGSVQTLGMKAHYYFTGHCPKNYKFMNPFYISNPELRKQLNSEYALLNRKYPDLSSVELERHEWLKNELKSWGEVQVKGRHVVGAGSIHPDTGYAYRVIKDIPLAEISEEIILEKFGKFVKKDTSTTKPLHAAFHIPSDLEKIPIDRLIDLTHFKSWGNGQYQGAHPLHGSSTGQNLSVDTIGNRWYCFRCNSGGDPLLWLAQEAGILDCEDCKPGALRGTDFQKVKKIAIERGLLNTESNGKKSKAINFTKRDFTQKEKLAVIDHFWTLPEVQSHPELYRSFEVLLAELEKEEMRRGKFRSGRKQCMTDNTHRIDFKVPWKSNSIFDREERNYYLNEQVEKAEFRIIPFREIYALTKPSLISKRLTRKEEKVIVNTFMKQLKDAINLYVMREKTQEKLGKIEVALLLFTHFWNDQKVHEPDYHLHLLLGSRIRINNEWYALKKEFFTEFLPKKQPQLLIHHVRRNELHLTLRKLYERPYDCISEASMSEDLEQVNYKLENANTV